MPIEPMNRIANYFPLNAAEVPATHPGAEWAEDVTRCYWQGVEDGREDERRKRCAHLCAAESRGWVNGFKFGLLVAASAAAILAVAMRG